MPLLHRGLALTVTHFLSLLDRCAALPSAEALHARLLKLRLLPHTLLANRLLALYSTLGAASHASLLFRDISSKNAFTYNILLAHLAKSGRLDDARHLFDEMPRRDVVSWNSMISGYATVGLVGEALELLYQMRGLGFRLSAFTYSIAASFVSTSRLAKEVHAGAVRSGLGMLSTVLGNSLIDMYGRVGLVRYAWNIFSGMENPDVISWNSVISAYSRVGHGDRALECFQSMGNCGFLADEFTMSAVINVCADLHDVAKGEQLLARCFKMGCLSNSIVASAVIDLYSKCGRMEDSIQLFQEVGRWDSALCNSMISAYVWNGLVHESSMHFLLAFKKDVRPTEFTFSSILSSSSCFGLTEQGTQIHCLTLKLGLEEELVVASALVDMYATMGSIESAMKIFSGVAARDLVSWNVMIMGLAWNGQGVAALRIFHEMQESGHHPDRSTLIGLLTACGHEGMVTEGKDIFSSMEEKFGIKPCFEHYVCMVDIMGRAGKLREAMKMIETMPHKPDASIWRLLLEACRVHTDLKFEEIVAERVMELNPNYSIPYYTLARIYGTRGKWERMARVLIAMKERGIRKVTDCSWIGIKNRISVFSSDQIFYRGGEAIYSALHLLIWEMEDEGSISEQYEEFEYG